MEPTLQNFSMWLRTAPAEHRADLQSKWQYKNFLTDSTILELPEIIWLAFLLPTELQTDPMVKKLRQNGQAKYKQPESFINITNPFAPEGPVVALCLLGILYDLEQEEVRLPYDSYQLWTEVADNFGMWRLRYYLEDAIFRNFDPENYELFDSVTKEKIALDEGMVKDVTSLVKAAAEASGVKNLEIRNREKNVYGVYKKVAVRQKNLNEIYDIHGFRLLTETQEDCYTVLKAVHHLWRPFPDRFKDYIKKPKPNGYQSLHTIVSCLQRHPVEFQIRTHEMDRVAVSGAANHAAYKKAQRKKS